jgi:hypothetical protein
MRRIGLISLLLVTAVSAPAPTSAAPPTPGAVGTSAAPPPSAASIVKPPPLIRVRMAAFVTADDDGQNQVKIKKTEIGKWVDNANASLAQAQSGIVIDYDPDADTTILKSTTLNWFDDLGGRSIPNAYFADPAFLGRMPVIFRSSGKGNGHGILPSSYVGMPGNYYGTSVPTDINPANGEYKWVQNHAQLAHDVGHYLGLAHTFPSSSDGAFNLPSKLVSWTATRTKKPGDFDGDGTGNPGNAKLWEPGTPVFEVTDTAPEFGASALRNGKISLCNPTVGAVTHDAAPPRGVSDPPRLTVEAGGALRLQGTSGGVKIDQVYKPDRTNVMSYYMCAPVMRFSGSQVKVMRQVLLGHPKRQHLFCANPDNKANPEYIKRCTDIAQVRALRPLRVLPRVPIFKGPLPKAVLDARSAPPASPTNIPREAPSY